MASGLSLKVLLQLQKKNFDTGLKSVQAGLLSLRKTITGLASAVVGGLGLSQMVSAFKDTAVKLSQVENTLKNVSDSVAEYEESLYFLKKIAGEYGVEQNALIQSFAKFHSAAKTSNLTMEQQKDIFKALTRAAGAFHLSSDETAHALLAVEQMLSKGKVSAEELRRQLGNSLPGAFNIMALAAGDAGITLNGTTAELDAAMRSGKVISEEILPFFAKRLDEVTKNASFDSLQSSLNRFQNSWTEFVRNSEFTGFYKGIVDGGSKALNSLGQNFKAFERILVDVLAGTGAYLSTKLVKKLIDIGNAANPVRVQYTNLEKELESVQKQIDKTNTLLAKPVNGKKGFSFSLSADEIRQIKSLSDYYSADYLNALEKAGKKHKILVTEAGRKVILQSRLNTLELKEIELLEQIEKENVAGLIKPMSKAQSLLQGIVRISKTLWATVKAIGAQMIAAFAVGLLVNFIQKLVEARKEAKRIADIPKDAREEWHKLSEETSNQMGKLDSQLAIYESENSSLETKIEALKTINQLLGREGDNMLTIEDSADKVRAAIEEQKQIIKEDAEELQRLAKLDEVSAKINELTRKQNELKESSDWMKTVIKFDKWGNSFDQLTPKAEKLKKKFNDLKTKIEQLIIAQKELAAGAPNGDENSGNGGRTLLTADEKEVKSALDSYQREVKKLNNQKENSALTEKEYQNELVGTQKKVMSTISTYEGLDKIVTKLGGSYKTLYEQIKNGSKKTTGGSGNGAVKDPVKEAMDKYIEAEHTLDNLLKNGIIDQETYNERLIDAAEACEEVVGAQDDMYGALERLKGSYREWFDLMQISKDVAKNEIKTNEEIRESLEKLDEKMEETAERKKKYQEAVKELGNIPVFDPTRDTSFDYKKEDSEILDENADKLEDYVKDLTKYKEGLEAIRKEHGYLTAEQQRTLEIVEKLLKQAGDGATTARAKATIAEITEDIKYMKLEIEDTNWDIFREGISGFEGIVSSIESCIDAFQKLDESDATWLDHLKAGFSVIDAFVNLIESVKAITEAMTTVQELSGRLQEAQAQRQIVLSKIKTEQAAKEGQTAMQVAAEKSAAAGIEIAADNAKASAAAKAAAGKAAESVASVPYVGPVLAVAAIATIVGALLAAFGKFANGGIVGGSKTQGDQNVIRANAGEMVLNKAQQGNLFNLIKNGGTGGSVDFRIRGADLVGVMRNYDSRLKG